MLFLFIYFVCKCKQIKNAELDICNDTIQNELKILQKSNLKLKTQMKDNITDQYAIKDLLNLKEIENKNIKCKFEMLEQEYHKVSKY